MIPLCVALTLLPLAAAPASSPSPVDRTITVSGEAEIRVAPNQVQLSLAIVSIDATLGKAKALTDDRVKKTLAALQAQGIEPKQMQTDHLSVQQRRDTSSSYKDTPSAYEVRRNLVVTIKDVKKFEATLAAVLESGANEIDGIQFLTTELRKHDAARAMAVKAAKEKAQALASELGLKVGKARSLSEGGSWSYWSPWSSRGGGMSQNVIQNIAGGGEPSDDGFAPGMISVRANVTVVFDLDGA
jgi:uncharacterized protein